MFLEMTGACSRLSDDLRVRSAEIKLVRDIRRSVRSNLSNVNIAMLARDLGFSKNHVANRFKKATGATLNGYITEERMKKAAELLKCGNKYIYEIALEVGYRDVVYFSRLFQRKNGRMPAQCRE